MIVCKVCGETFTNQRRLSAHLNVAHSMLVDTYRTQFGLYKVCIKCHKVVSRKCKGDFCNKCRPRSGALNSFYGKKHTKDTIKRIKEITAVRTTNLWKDPTYRNKVIVGTTGKTRSSAFKEEQAVNAYKQFLDPAQRTLRSTIMKNTWEEGRIQAHTKLPSTNKSKLELEVMEYLSAVFGVAYGGTIRVGTLYRYPDMVIGDKIIVEYYGNHYHAHPTLYKPTDIIGRTGKTASEIWEHDTDRTRLLEEAGYRVIVVWEKQYKLGKQCCLDSLVIQIKEMLGEPTKS